MDMQDLEGLKLRSSVPLSVEDLGDALGTVSMASFWEAKMAELDAGFAGDMWRWNPPENDLHMEKGGGEDLAMAVQAAAKATASNSLQAMREAKDASSKVQELDEKLCKHSREHWLGLDCLQEKVNNMAVSQKEVIAELKGNLQKELASVHMQLQSLYEQCEAIKDMVANVRSELSQKASLDQLEDLEHQQCKAMESLLRRWDRCAESRRQLVETQVGQVLGEVQRPEARTKSSQPTSEVTHPRVEEISSAQKDLARKMERFQVDLTRSTEQLHRLDDVSQEQIRLKHQHQQLVATLEELQHSAQRPSLEDHPNDQWHQRYKGLSTKVESLQGRVEVLQKSFQGAKEKANKEQAVLDGLRLRADAAAEGLASEVRLREEGVQRLEAQLQSLTRDMDIAMETLRGSVEKQLHAMLTTAQSAAERKQRDWQLECQKRQDVEGALKEQQCEMAEMRSKLMRKEQALLEATGLYGSEPQWPCNVATNGPSSEPVVPRGADLMGLSRRLTAPVASGSGHVSGLLNNGFN